MWRSNLVGVTDISEETGFCSLYHEDRQQVSQKYLLHSTRPHNVISQTAAIFPTSVTTSLLFTGVKHGLKSTEVNVWGLRQGKKQEELKDCIIKGFIICCLH
jgi:hypothetical protein